MYDIARGDLVLFVDDEPHILSSIKRSLMDARFSVVTASSAEKAITIMQESNVAVLVTDLKMPTVSGIDLIKIVSEKFPDVVKIVLSAYYQMSTVLSVIKSGEIFYYFTKPWKMEDDFMSTLEKAIIHHKEKKEQMAAFEHSEEAIAKLQQELKSVRSFYNQLKVEDQYNVSILKYSLEEYTRLIRMLDALAAESDGRARDALMSIKAEGVNVLKKIQKTIAERR